MCAHDLRHRFRLPAQRYTCDLLPPPCGWAEKRVCAGFHRATVCVGLLDGSISGWPRWVAVTTAVERALVTWGACDRDDPFPLFAKVRELGAVHAVTLADGHDAWLVVRYEEARAALKDPRLSKDMLAALATGAGVVAEGLPGPAFARHMLSVDPPDHTRLRRLVQAAFSPGRIDGLRPRVQTVVDDLLDGVAAQGSESRVDLVGSFAFPLPFTVICDLLGVPESDRAALGRGLTAMLAPTSTPAEYEPAKAASDAVVEMLGALVDAKQTSPSDDLVSALISARDGDERLNQQELLSTIFQLIVRDTTRRRPSSATPSSPCIATRISSPPCARTRTGSPQPSRSSSATTRPSPTRPFATRPSQLRSPV